MTWPSLASGAVTCIGTRRSEVGPESRLGSHSAEAPTYAPCGINGTRQSGRASAGAGGTRSAYCFECRVADESSELCHGQGDREAIVCRSRLRDGPMLAITATGTCVRDSRRGCRRSSPGGAACRAPRATLVMTHHKRRIGSFASQRPPDRGVLALPARSTHRRVRRQRKRMPNWARSSAVRPSARAHT